MVSRVNFDFLSVLCGNPQCPLQLTERLGWNRRGQNRGPRRQTQRKL